MLPADFEATEVRERRCVICGVPVSKCSPLTDMRDDQHRFLILLGQLPARLSAEQAAWVFELPAALTSRRSSPAKLLKPLGNPPANGIKFFATADLLEFADKDATGWCACPRPFTSIGTTKMLRNETANPPAVRTVDDGGGKSQSRLKSSGSVRFSPDSNSAIWAMLTPSLPVVKMKSGQK